MYLEFNCSSYDLLIFYFPSLTIHFSLIVKIHLMCLVPCELKLRPWQPSTRCHWWAPKMLQNLENLLVSDQKEVHCWNYHLTHSGVYHTCIVHSIFAVVCHWLGPLSSCDFPFMKINTSWSTAYYSTGTLQVPHRPSDGQIKCSAEVWGPGQNSLHGLFWHWGEIEQQHYLLQSVFCWPWLQGLGTNGNFHFGTVFDLRGTQALA